ncbi:MAG: DUF5667 domain-containing protein [Methanoregula sp.]
MIHRKIRLAVFLFMSLIMVVGLCAASDENIPGENTTATVTIVVPADAAGDDTILIAPQPVFGTMNINGNLTPYDGPNGPGSAMYGFEIAMENLDETFTFNQTERLNKQMDHAQLRIRETIRELALNRSDRADEALDLYWQKLDQTQETLAPFDANPTDLLRAQEMIVQHQTVLAGLKLSHPNNTGLIRAYNNSRLLEQKFEEKTLMNTLRNMDRNEKTTINTIRQETEYQNRDGTGAGNQTEIKEQTRQNVQVQGNQTQRIPQGHGEITKQTQDQEQKNDITVSPQQTQKLSDSSGNQNRNNMNQDNPKGNDNGKSRNT